MRYYCDKSLKGVKKKSKNYHLKSKSHKEFEKDKHLILSLKNVNIKVVDEILSLHMKVHNKKFNHYLLKNQSKLVFNDKQNCKYLITGMIINTTNISRSNYLREAIDCLKTADDFSQIAEIDIISLAHKRDMTYDFYLKHNMSAFEWKLNALINKDKNLINKLPRIWRHPIITKFDCYHV